MKTWVHDSETRWEHRKSLQEQIDLWADDDEDRANLCRDCLTVLNEFEALLKAKREASGLEERCRLIGKGVSAANELLEPESAALRAENERLAVENQKMRRAIQSVLDAHTDAGQLMLERGVLESSIE